MDKESRLLRRQNKKDNRTPFFQTGVGKFLKSSGSGIVDIIGDVLPDKGILGIVKGLIDKDNGLSAEDKQTALNMLELEYKDIANARALQVAALNQDDLFSKRFLYYFALGICGFSMTIVLLLFFVEIPESNRRIVDMILGVIIGSGLISVINFFFGSSKGSKDKQDFISNL